MKMNKKQIEKEVKKLDPNLEEGEETFKIAMVLLSALQIGVNVKKISEFTKISEKDIKKYEKNLRANKIWVGDKTCCDWFNKKHGSISFWLDVSCAQGYIEKVEEKKK